MTRRGAVSLSEADARAVIATVVRDLVERGQIEQVGAPAVLAALTAHHVLVRVDYAALQIRDRTFPDYDLAAFERPNTATGHFVRSLRAKIDATADDTERANLELALRLGLHALHGRKELRARPLSTEPAPDDMPR